MSEKKEQKLCVKLCHVIQKKPTTLKPQVKKTPKKNKPKKIKPKKIQKKIKKPESKVLIPLKDAKPVKRVEEILMVDKNETKVLDSQEEEIIVDKNDTKTFELQKEVVAVADTNTQNNKENTQASPEEEYINEHIAKISQLLQDNLYYPRSARKRNIVGNVMVKFTLGTDSKVRGIKVVSSEHEVLSRAAIKTIESLSGEFPRPKEKLTLQVPICYSLK